MRKPESQINLQEKVELDLETSDDFDDDLYGTSSNHNDQNQESLA